MAASLEAQGIPTLDEILSHHGLQRENVNRECSQGIRYEISVKIVNWKMVGRLLGIPEEKLAAIQWDNNTEEERRFVMIHTWRQRQGSQATYLSLMMALYQHHCCDLIEQLCCMIKSHAAVITRNQPESNRLEIKVKDKLNAHELEERFRDLCRRLKTELLRKNIPVEDILDSLTLLPMELKLEYDESIQAKLPQIQTATTITELMPWINPLFTYIDYNLLNYLASKFGSPQLKADMSSYIQDVQVFMHETTVHDIMPLWQGTKIPDGFSELWIKIKADPESYTLQELQEFRNKHCATIKLSKVLSSIKSLIPARSFFVVLLVPTATTIEVAKAIDFYREQQVSMVVLDNKLLYLMSDSTDQSQKETDKRGFHGTRHNYSTSSAIALSKIQQARPSELYTNGFRCSFIFEPLKCHICELIPHEAYKANCCQRHYCKVCISSLEEHYSKCPGCSKTITYSHDKEYNEVICQFEVYCENRCGWKGLLKEHDSHLNNINPSDETWLDGCPTATVKCSHCKKWNTFKEKRRFFLVNQGLETTFTTSKLDVICCITNEVSLLWYQIGGALGLKQAQLIRIAQDFSGVSDCYQQVLKQWIELREGANWNKLLHAFRAQDVQSAKTLSRKVERMIVCRVASELEVKHLKEEAESLLQDYMGQQNNTETTDIRESMKKYYQSLNEEIEYLKWEENAKLLDKGYGQSRRKQKVVKKPENAEGKIIKGLAVGSTVGSAVGLGTAGAIVANVATTTAEFAIGGALLGPVGAIGGLATGLVVGGVTGGIVAALTIEQQRKRKLIEDKYTKLIDTCNSTIVELHPYVWR